jgi:hypothetical protein
MSKRFGHYLITPALRLAIHRTGCCYREKLLMPPSMRRQLALVILLGALGPGAALAGNMDAKTATIIVNYAAEQTCSCMFVSGRTLKSCKTDFDPFAKPYVTVQVTNHLVTARVANYPSGSARYYPAVGCVLQR